MTKLAFGVRVVQSLSFSKFSAILFLSFAPTKFQWIDTSCKTHVILPKTIRLVPMVYENYRFRISFSIVRERVFPAGVHNTEVKIMSAASECSMENDLKRVARLEYLKLRQSKQTEKVEAVKVIKNL